METVYITTEYIKLDQFLKFSGTVSDGSDAKFLIAEGFVEVNGETETRRGKKLYPGDNIRIEYDGQQILLNVCD